MFYEKRLSKGRKRNDYHWFKDKNALENCCWWGVSTAMEFTPWYCHQKGLWSCATFTGEGKTQKLQNAQWWRYIHQVTCTMLTKVYTNVGSVSQSVCHTRHYLLLKTESGYVVLTFYSKFAEIEASQFKIHFGGQLTSVPLSREAFEVQHQYLRKPLNTKGLSTFTMCFALSTCLSI